MAHASRSSIRPIALLAFASCAPGGGGGGGGGIALQPSTPDPELVLARARAGAEHADSQIRGLLADGLGERRLIDSNGFERHPRIAPDGLRVAYSRRRRSNDDTSLEIFVGTRDGSAAELRLTNDAAIDDSPTWSPDGAWLTFASDRLGNGARLFRIAADGTGLALLFDDGTETADPDFGPRAGRIAFARRAMTGRFEIWTILPDGSGAQRITDGGATGDGDREPAWSPDGHSILFTRVLDATHAVLATVDVSGGVVNPWNLSVPIARSPRFSPRGDRVFFAAGDPATGVTTLRLHTARTDGSDPRLLAPDDRYDVVGVDCAPSIAVAPQDTLVWTELHPARAVVSNLFGHRADGLFDDVLDDDGKALTITTSRQGSLQVGGLELTFATGLDGRDVAAIEVTVDAAISDLEAATRLRLTIADYVAQRHATMALLPLASSASSVHTFTVGGLRCIDRRGDLRVSVVAEKAVDAPGDLSVDFVRIRVLHVDRP